MTTLELRFLGGLTIHQAGRLLTTLKSQKGQALLCYLAMTGKAHTRSVLAGLFWPEMLEENALMNLRNVLNKLNQHLGPYLLNTRQTIAFNREAAYWLDVADFEAGLAAKADIGRLQTAVALYRGDFLDGFDLDDAPQFEGWVLGQRARLREAALAALHRLVTHFASKGTSDMAITYARQLLAVEPWREEAHRDLMRLLALSGQRSAALIQYETCRRILAEELSVEPAPATLELYRQIKENAVTEERPRTLSLPSPTDREPPIPSAPHNLPAQSTPLIGRETELKSLSKLLAKTDGRLITIVGIGGMGKTRLALTLAERQVTARQNNYVFTDGVYFVPLASLSEASHILSTLAQAIGFQPQSGDPRTPVQQVLDFLRRKRMLLVFDNFEHVLEGAGLLVDILQAAPQVEILVTSREPLRLYEEQLFSLKGLSFSETKVTEEDTAVQLFLQRAQWMQPDFVLHEADLPHLTTICLQTGGIPLALELAAAWVDTLTLSEIAGELAQSLNLLQTKWRNVPDRHHSVRATFELSWQRLSDEEQQIFSRLSVFRGGFTRKAAWQVCAPEKSQTAFLRILAALAGKSLLRAVSTPDRFGLHELLRQFAAEKLAQTQDEETVVCDRHSTYYCTFLHTHTEHWHTARQIETLAAVTREADNTQPALHWALAQGEWQRLVQAIDSWGWFLDWQGRDADGESFCRAIVEQAEKQVAKEATTSPDCLRLWSKALTWQGRFYIYGDDDPLLLFQQSLALLTQIEPTNQVVGPDKAFILNSQGFVLASDGTDLQTAQRYEEQALALYHGLGDKWGIAQSLVELGRIDQYTGHFTSATDKLQAALTIQQEQGDRREQSKASSILGHVYNALGHLDEAERLHREALRLSTHLGDRPSLCRRKGHLAMTLLLQGKFGEAFQLAGESLAICQDLGIRFHESWIRRTLGETLLHNGQYQHTKQEAARALAVDAELRLNKDGRLFNLLGDLALVESAYGEAQKAFRESVQSSREQGINYRVGLALGGLGYTACHLDQWPQARQHLAEALDSALALKAYMSAVYALPGVALLLAASGDAARAVEIWALAKRHPFVANSKWFEDVVGRELEDLAATLPPELAKAARERGQALDLWETVEALLGELEGTSEV
jgi:predicted ATPase/DNA-binding SARP family transcriptional activator